LWTSEGATVMDKAELQKGIRYHKFMRGDPTKRQVAITFDDGPHPDTTPRLLKRRGYQLVTIDDLMRRQ
jgi:hypothetical protein